MSLRGGLGVRGQGQGQLGSHLEHTRGQKGLELGSGLGSGSGSGLGLGSVVTRKGGGRVRGGQG